MTWPSTGDVWCSARAEQLGQTVVLRPRRRFTEDAEEPLAHGEVEPDDQRGLHRCGTIGLRRRCGDGALHPIEQPLLDVVTHEGVQPELAAEVVVQRARRDVGVRRELADGHLVERLCPELPTAASASLPFGEVDTGIHSRMSHNGVML